MSDSPGDLDSLRSTGAEADRLLKSLETEPLQVQQKPVQRQPVQSHPAVPAQHASSSPSAQEQANPVMVLLIVAIVLTPFLFAWVTQTSSQSPRSANPPLRYSASCGSPSGAGKRWWPVLGRANRQLLKTIRNRYCADAYINEEGALQVASFDSWNGAESFRLRLEAATGSSFRVGQGRY